MDETPIQPHEIRPVITEMIRKAKIPRQVKNIKASLEHVLEYANDKLKRMEFRKMDETTYEEGMPRPGSR